MTDTTAKILPKGCENTGLTEEIASDLFRKVGSHFMAIVELEVVYPHGPNTDGKRRIDLRIKQVEPAMDSTLSEHLRELTRTLHYNRQVATHGPTLDGGEERTVDDVLAAGKKHEPHPYLASTLSIDDDAICDVCGQVESAAVHADRDQLADPFAVTEPDDADEETEEEPETGDEEYVDEGEWDDENAAEREELPVT